MYWRKRTDTLNFTNNHGLGQGHWRLADHQLLGWIGRSLDPPRRAVSLTACKDIFAGYQAYPGDPVTYVWGGEALLVGRFSGRMLIGCEATVPVGHGSTVTCFAMNDRQILIDDSAPCDAFRFLRREDASTLLAINSNGCCTDSVQRLRWNGAGFQTVDTFEACKSVPPKPIPPELLQFGTDIKALDQYCGYPP